MDGSSIDNRKAIKYGSHHIIQNVGWTTRLHPQPVYERGPYALPSSSSTYHTARTDQIELTLLATNNSIPLITVLNINNTSDRFVIKNSDHSGTQKGIVGTVCGKDLQSGNQGARMVSNAPVFSNGMRFESYVVSGASVQKIGKTSKQLKTIRPNYSDECESAGRKASTTSPMSVQVPVSNDVAVNPCSTSQSSIILDSNTVCKNMLLCNKIILCI